MPAAFLTRKDYDEVKHLLNICNINGAEVEPFPIAVTRYHFKEAQHE
jgi:hypothetical protein